MAYKNTTDSAIGEAVPVTSYHIYPAHTTDTASCRIILNRERINLESYQLIWLDSNAHNISNNNTAVTLTNLRKVVDYTKLYNEQEECIQYIKQTSKTMTFLVCSGLLGQEIVALVHPMKNIWTIYIYCQNKHYHEEWAANYSKIKGVYTKLVDLLNDLKSDVQKYIQYEKDTRFIGAGREDNTTIKLHNDWWPYFVDFLCYLPYPANYHNRLIDLLKQYYAGKKDEIETLKDFAENYTPKKAIWWYTRETFLYRLFNQALRQQNIKIVFLFGFFLRDIYTELQQQYQVLKSKYSKQSLKLYRGQIMSAVELENLLKCCENADTYRIIITSCFSTSLNRSLSLSMIPQEVEPDKFVRVLFEITIDVAQPNGTNPNGRYLLLGSTIRPFGDISTVSFFPNESEILFMPGSGFQLNKSGLIFSESKNLWIIQLEPVDDHFHATQEYFISSNARRTLQNCITAIPFELQLQSLSLDQIDIIFDHLISVYPMEEWILAVKERFLAVKLLEKRPSETSTQKTERESLVLSKYEKALKIWFHYTSDTDLNSFIAIGSLHQALAGFRGLASTAVNKKKHYDLAITNFQLALDKAVTDHESIYILYLLFRIYRSLMLSKGKDEIKQYGPQCRYYAELSLNKMVKVYPENDMRTAQLFEELGMICSFHLSDHDAALAYNKEALAIKLRNPNQCPWMLYTNISSYYFARKAYPEALRFQLFNHEDILNRFALKATDNDATRRDKRYMIARSYMTVGDYYAPLDRQLSLQYLQMAKNLYQELEHPSSATEIEKIEKNIKALCI